MKHSRVALVVTGAMLLTAAVWAADNRTVLTPGWNMFSPQQDIEVGQEVSPDAERQLQMLNNSRVDNYVDTLGRRLAAKAPGEKYPYHFQVVDDRAINAFALPGGPVYINRGVLEAADNESQLAGVIAHEISHVALRHGTNQASKAAAAQMPLAILGGLLGSDSTKAMLVQLGASFAMNSVLLKYSRTAESEADIMGTQILYDAGYDPRAMGQFFQKLEAEQQGSGPVEFFSNHPNPDHRIERVTQEVAALGGVRRGALTNSGQFDQSKRYVLSLPPPTDQSRQADANPRASALVIVSASYGANDRFLDVRQRLQSLVENDRLDLQVTNSSMGGDPIREAKTLLVRYQWRDRTHDVTVRERDRLSIPTGEQVANASSGNGGGGGRPDAPSERFVNGGNALLQIRHPENWQVYGQGDAMTIAPRGGLIDDGRGNQAMAYGLVVNVFDPRPDSAGQQLQGAGHARASAEDAATWLDQSTDDLIQQLRLSNRSMRVIRDPDVIRVDGDRALSSHLSNDSPLGDRETDWLITVAHPDGLLFLVFAAPDSDVQRYQGAFDQMLRSVRIKR